jgi:hypothetical protein
MYENTSSKGKKRASRRTGSAGVHHQFNETQIPPSIVPKILSAPDADVVETKG